MPGEIQDYGPIVKRMFAEILQPPPVVKRGEAKSEGPFGHPRSRVTTTDLPIVPPPRRWSGVEPFNNHINIREGTYMGKYFQYLTDRTIGRTTTYLSREACKLAARHAVGQQNTLTTNEITPVNT